jgi:Fe-S oxidoreductase
MNRVVNVSAFMARPSADLRTTYDQVPIDVAGLLRAAGVDFGYLYEDDLYTGALAYDLGSDEAVAEHAKRVHEVFKKHGVKTVITIDPHTTNMLRSVYPKLLSGYDLEVRTYLEVLAEKEMPLTNALQGDIAIHDPCVFARYEGIIDQPRQLLAATGLTVKEPEKSGRMTWCCGGPVESLYPEKAHANAVKRAEQLRETAPEVVTMCPMCLINLGGAAGPEMTINDISHYLKRAHGA